MKIFKEILKLGDKELIIETGEIARQATGSVTVKIGDLVILVTTTAKKEIKDGIDFFPLTVHYQEKY